MDKEDTAYDSANSPSESNVDKTKKTEMIPSNNTESNQKNSDDASIPEKKDSESEINSSDNDKVNSLITQVNENSDDVKKNNSKAKKSNMKKLKKIDNNNTIFPTENDEADAETKPLNGTNASSSNSLKKSKIKQQMSEINNNNGNNSVFK